MMFLRKPPEREWIEPEKWFLCHRGVKPSVIEEIVAALTENDQHVAVQDGDGLSLSLRDLRALVQRQLEGDRRIIALLNEHLPGPVYRQTFAPLKKAYITCIRVEGCDLEGVDWVRADLADVTDATLRRKIIASIVRNLSREECR